MVLCRPHITKARLACVASCHLLPLAGVRNTVLAGEHFKKKWATIMKSLPNTDTLFHPAAEPFEDLLTKFLEIILNWLWRVSRVYILNMTAVAEASQQGLWLDCAPWTQYMCVFSCLSSSPLALSALHWWDCSGSLLGCSTETEAPGNTRVRQRAHIDEKLPSLSSANFFKIRAANRHHKQTLVLTIFIQIEESPNRGKKKLRQRTSKLQQHRRKAALPNSSSSMEYQMYRAVKCQFPNPGISWRAKVPGSPLN